MLGSSYSPARKISSNSHDQGLISGGVLSDIFARFILIQCNWKDLLYKDKDTAWLVHNCPLITLYYLVFLMLQPRLYKKLTIPVSPFPGAIYRPWRGSALYQLPASS